MKYILKFLDALLFTFFVMMIVGLTYLICALSVLIWDFRLPTKINISKTLGWQNYNDEFKAAIGFKIGFFESMKIAVNNSQKNTLDVTYTERGGFHKACHNGVRIDKEKLFTILDIDGYCGHTLEYHLDIFSEKRHDYTVTQSETDVS